MRPMCGPTHSVWKKFAGHLSGIEHLAAFPAHRAHPRRVLAGHAGEDRIPGARRHY